MKPSRIVTNGSILSGSWKGYTPDGLAALPIAMDGM